ncbi:MAG: carbon-nitrogen hydrolase family protein, partial [Peptococcus niger]
TLACAPARRLDSGYTSWAHSMVVNPWATIEHDLGTEAGLRLARIDKSSLQAVRTQIPLQEARR